MNDLVVFDKVKAEIEGFKQENRSLVFDYEDPKDNKEARSHVHKLRGVKTQVTTVHKDLKADALAFCREVDAKKKELIGEVDEMIEVHAKPIKEIQDRKDAAFAAIAEKERLDAERVESERLEKIRLQEEAAATETARLQAERNQLERDKEKLEAESRGEQEARRREQLAREQGERDKLEAIEQAKRDREEALDRAEAEKEAAVEAEKARAQQEAAIAKAKQDRLDAIERKRVENEGHRASVEQGIISQIDELLIDGGRAAEIVTAISKGEITNLTINY
ncbi:hypothetical protein KAR91_50575 [Candidatus Pacearchaeota archaeon]|nr:hypothetical protein [Candidatus Pacearchaeota archaeon]